MPTYVYHCAACDVTFERFHSIRSHAEARCSICGSEVKQVYKNFGGFVMKGTSPRDSQKSETCCSQGSQCDHPKRCCEH